MPADSFESPLTLAACGGHVELAMLLLERGANIEEVNDEGRVYKKPELSRKTHPRPENWGGGLGVKDPETTFLMKVKNLKFFKNSTQN